MPNLSATSGNIESNFGSGSGSGNVSGPASSIAGNIATFGGTDGKSIADAGISTKNVENYLGTGLLSGCAISINVDTTKIDISTGSWYRINNSTPGTPVFTPVTFTGATAVALTYLATYDATYIALDTLGNVIQQTSPFTPDQRRVYLVLGAVIHSNRTNVNLVNNLPDVAIDGVCQLNDLMDGLKNFNIIGNNYSANGANLNINKNDGYIFKRGANFFTSNLNPHTLHLASQTAPTDLRYRLQDGTEYADTAVIDPNYYDNAGVKTAVPSNKWTVQRIVLFASGKTRIQYGQMVYGSSALAIQGVISDAFVTEKNMADNGLLRYLLVVQQGATALNTSTSAIFLECDKFGGTHSATSGTAVTTLQQAYTNSAQPQVITDATRGSFQIKRGSSNDTDKVFEVLNGAGASVLSLFGNGHTDLSQSINEFQGADIASASTTDIGAATGNLVKVTGNVTITGLGTVQAGTRRTVIFTGTPTLTHNATSLILPTGANITAAANDRAVFHSLGSGNWICTSYQRADGTALVGASSGGYEFERLFLSSPMVAGLDSEVIARANSTLSKITLDCLQLPIAIQYLTTAGTTDFPIGNTASNTKISEVFTASSSYSAVSLAVRVKKVGSPTDNLSVNLYATSANLPTGSSVATASYALAGAEATTSYVDYAWEIPSYALTASTVYAIVIERSGAVDASNYWVVEGIAIGGAAGAQMALYSGSTWSANGTNMLRFAINGADIVDIRKRSDETAQANTDSLWTNYFAPAFTPLASTRMKQYAAGFTTAITALDRVQYNVRNAAYLPSIGASVTMQ